MTPAAPGFCNRSRDYGDMLGECNCGAVAFELSAALTDIYVCHCSICRRSTGANGIAVLVTEKNHLRWLRGEDNIRTWEKPGHDWQTWFCASCGSTLPGSNDEATVFIPAGLLNDAGDTLHVAHHIWVDSRAAWDVIGDQGRQHPQGFGTAGQEPAEAPGPASHSGSRETGPG